MKRHYIYGILLAAFLSTGWSESTERPKRKPLPRRGPPAVEEYFKKLEQQDPEEVQRLRELQQTDPQAFRKELRRRVHQQQKQKSHHPARERRATMEEYVANLQNATTPEEREQAMIRIRTSIAERLDRGFEIREQAIQNMREKLSTLEERHLQDKQNREEIIARQMKRIEKAAQATSTDQPSSPGDGPPTDR